MGDVETVQPGRTQARLLVGEGLGHVLRQIAGRLAGLGQRSGPHRQVTEQLDMHEATTPGCSDLAARYDSADREMQVQAVTGLVPLRHPHVRERRAAQAGAQRPEEIPDIGAGLTRVMTAAHRRRSACRDRFSRFAAQ